jgi:hypothetical protein
MATTKTNPLDSLSSPLTGPADLRLPQLPNLSSLVSGLGFKAGLEAFDVGLESWKQSAERIIVQAINDRLAVKPATISKSGIT